MALWLTALKVIPWGDVVAAAPTVARSARELWRGVRGEGDLPGEAIETPVAAADPLAALEGRLAVLEERLGALQRDAASSAELVSSLAEQNERLVEAVAILRARTRLLAGVAVALAAAVVGIGWRAFG